VLGVWRCVERRHLLISGARIEPARLNEIISRVQLEPGDSVTSGNDLDLRQQRDPNSSAALLLHHEHPGDLSHQTRAEAKTNAADGTGVSVGNH